MAASGLASLTTLAVPALVVGFGDRSPSVRFNRRIRRPKLLGQLCIRPGSTCVMIESSVPSPLRLAASSAAATSSTIRSDSAASKRPMARDDE